MFEMQHWSEEKFCAWADMGPEINDPNLEFWRIRRPFPSLIGPMLNNSQNVSAPIEMSIGAGFSKSGSAKLIPGGICRFLGFKQFEGK